MSGKYLVMSGLLTPLKQRIPNADRMSTINDSSSFVHRKVMSFNYTVMSVNSLFIVRTYFLIREAR